MVVRWDESTPQTIPIMPIERGNKKTTSIETHMGLKIHKSQVLMLEEANINILKQAKPSVTFIEISWLKYLNGLWFQPPFSYDQYEKMSKLLGVKIRKDKENRDNNVVRIK